MESQRKKWAVLCSITFVFGAAIGAVGFLASSQTSAAGHAMAKDFRGDTRTGVHDFEDILRMHGGKAETDKAIADLSLDNLARAVLALSHTSQLKERLGDSSAIVEQLKQQLEEMKQDLDDPELQELVLRAASEQIRMLRQPKILPELMKMFDDPKFMEVAHEVALIVEPLANDPKTMEVLGTWMFDTAVADQVTLLSFAMEDHLGKDEKRTATAGLLAKSSKKAFGSRSMKFLNSINELMNPVRGVMTLEMKVGETEITAAVPVRKDRKAKILKYSLIMALCAGIGQFEKPIGKVLVTYAVSGLAMCANEERQPKKMFWQRR